MGRDRARDRRRAGGGPASRETIVSKKLSWLLRHGAEKEGLTLGHGGYVNAADALNTHCLRSLKVTFDELKSAVATSDKQRFSLIPVAAGPRDDRPEPTTGSIDLAPAATVQLTPSADVPPDPFVHHGGAGDGATDAAAAATDPDDPRGYLIRANQGHSLPVASEQLLRAVELGDPVGWPRMAVHGTSREAWELIRASGGLKRMGRVHVHFATGVTGDLAHLLEEGEKGGPDRGDGEEVPQVISGMRRSVAVLIFVDLEKALKAGLKFWRSENDVILSEGDEEGVISSVFFKRVVERSGKVLMRDGEVVAE